MSAITSPSIRLSLERLGGMFSEQFNSLSLLLVEDNRKGVRNGKKSVRVKVMRSKIDTVRVCCPTSYELVAVKVIPYKSVTEKEGHEPGASRWLRYGITAVHAKSWYGTFKR